MSRQRYGKETEAKAAVGKRRQDEHHQHNLPLRKDQKIDDVLIEPRDASAERPGGRLQKGPHPPVEFIDFIGKRKGADPRLRKDGLTALSTSRSELTSTRTTAPINQCRYSDHKPSVDVLPEMALGILH